MTAPEPDGETRTVELPDPASVDRSRDDEDQAAGHSGAHRDARGGADQDLNH